MRSVLAIILGGGRGSRLFPLTAQRSKPAVPVAGKYRLIDIPISNCINSGLHQIYVLTQFLSVSLHRHIANTYKFDMFSHGFVEILAAQQTNETADWYQGTADAVRQNISYIEREEPDEVLILSGDQLYRMDYSDLIRTHRESKAEVTIAAIPVLEKDTPGFGLMSMADDGRVTGFVEKPKTAEERDPYHVPAEWIQRQGIPCNGRHYLANMGIYLFKTEVLLELLTARPLATDFGKEVFPRNYKTRRVQAHLFDGYWEDLGTIRSYHEASLGAGRVESAVRLLHPRWRDLHPDAEPAGQPDQRGGDGAQPGGRRVRGGARQPAGAVPAGSPQPGRVELRAPRHDPHRVRRIRDREATGRERPGGAAEPEHRRWRGDSARDPGQGLPRGPWGAVAERGGHAGGGRA